MRKLRFNIASLLLVVLFAAVGFAGLRESNEIWDSSVFTVTLGVLLISVLLVIHRTERRRAFWLGFAAFGSAYLGLTQVPSIESRLLSTKVLGYLDSKVSRSIHGELAFTGDLDNDGKIDLYVLKNSQQSALYRNKGNGTSEDVTATAGLSSTGTQGAADDGSVYRVVTAAVTSYRNVLAGQWLGGSGGSTENFMRIGHSLLALIFAFLGGQLSRQWYGREHRSRSGAARAHVG
jgi:hypothetical protein